MPETCEICENLVKDGEQLCGCEVCGRLFGPCCNSEDDNRCNEDY